MCPAMLKAWMNLQVAVVIRHQLQEVAEITAIYKASSTILLAMLFHSACDKSDIALQWRSNRHALLSNFSFEL